MTANFESNIPDDLQKTFAQAYGQVKAVRALGERIMFILYSGLSPDSPKLRGVPSYQVLIYEKLTNNIGHEYHRCFYRRSFRSLDAARAEYENDALALLKE